MAEAFRAKKAGLKMLVNAADVHELLAGGLAVNVTKLKEQPDQVRRMLKALAQALIHSMTCRHGLLTCRKPPRSNLEKVLLLKR